MGWDSRERGTSYYTRSRKVGDRVVREYVGGGLVGQLAAETDRVERERLEVEALRRRQERERLETLVSPVLEMSEAAEILAQAYLVAAGYRRVEGHWRRRREGTC